MAMKRIGWQNGTLIQPAQVLDDGTVQPAQYEGTTPLSAANLTKMEDNIEEYIEDVSNEVGDLSDLNTTDKTSVVNAINSLVPVVLYENEAGTNGDITLNDSVENYTFIEVFYRNNDNFYTSRKFYKPSGKKIILDSRYVSADFVNFKNQYRVFQGTNFTVEVNAEVSSKNMSGVPGVGQNTYVLLILGYK